MDYFSFDIEKIHSFSEALLCNPTVYTWRYSSDGMLTYTNCPENVYHRIFEHTGCLSYMITEGLSQRTPLILSAALGILWAVIYEWEDDKLLWCYVIGPVFHNEVNNDLLDETIQYYHIDPNWRPIFFQAMHGIPAVSSILFFQYAIMMHSIVNHEKLSRSDLRFQDNVLPQEGKKQIEHRSRHRTYQAEQALLEMVKEGNMNYRSAMEKAGQLSSGIGISTNDPIQRAMLSSCNFTALCTRAAIEGGLTPDTAYTVGDSYIQSLQECKTIADVRTVNHAMYEDFIQRVHRLKANPKYSQQIQSCAAYIEAHLDEPLTLKELAHEVGYSEYHLSRKFKEETGKNIHQYIKIARVKRAKFLLSTTNLSIKEIAKQLHFSASSHFASIFKEITGQLPQQYRNEYYK